jgi:hypothetical protein
MSNKISGRFIVDDITGAKAKRVPKENGRKNCSIVILFGGDDVKGNSVEHTKRYQ